VKVLSDKVFTVVNDIKETDKALMEKTIHFVFFVYDNHVWIFTVNDLISLLSPEAFILTLTS